MLTEHLFFISWTPFIVGNMWSFTVSTFWLLFFSVWASFVRVAFSTDNTLNFCLTVFGRMSEILAVIKQLDGNGSTKLASAGSLHSIWNIWSILPSLLLLIRSASACLILLWSKSCSNSSLLNSVGTPSATLTFVFILVGFWKTYL